MSDNQASVCHCMNCRLIDDLLVEIFLRLPSAELVCQCKCVCKRWLYLTSQSDFVARFIAHKVKTDMVTKVGKKEEVDEEQEYPPAYIFLFSKMRSHVYHGNFALKPHKYLLSFVPGYDKDEKRPVIANAWHNDLILCANPGPKELNLYLCNPRTKKYLHLPPLSRRIRPYFAGLTCDPYYRYDKENGNVTVRSFFRYCICYCGLFEKGQVIKHLELEIFCSEDGFWRKAILLPPKGRVVVQTEIKECFTYNNMMHFYWPDYIVCFDPYSVVEDGIIPSHYIRIPCQRDDVRIFNSSLYSSTCLGVYGGRIRVIQYHTRLVVPIPKDISEVSLEEENDAYKFEVWELKNYTTGEWSLDFIVYQHQLVSEDYNLSEQIRRGCPTSTAYRMHPYDPDIVIMQFHRLFAECNLRKKTLEPICRVSSGLVSYGLALPWWPSPLAP